MTSTNSTTPMPADSNTQATPASPTSPPSAPLPAGRVARLFSPADLAKIAEAVTRAETRTSAEIVPVVAAASGRYDRAEDLFGLWLGSIAFIVVAILYPAPTDPGSWDTLMRSPLGVFASLALLLGFTFLGAFLATRFPRLADPFVSKREALHEVQRRAADCFTNLRVASTRQRDALLIFVSLRERLAWVIADDAVMARFKPGDFDPIARAVAEGFKARQPARAMLDAIESAAQILERAMPPEPGQASDLPNALRVIE